MSWKIAPWLLAILLVGSGCRHGAAPAAGGRSPAQGDAIWLTDPAAVSDADLEPQLQRIGAAALFVPAGEAVRERQRWIVRPDPAPTRPLSRVPVVLVVRVSTASVSATGSAGGDAEGIAAAIALAVSAAGRPGGPYGRVVGVLVDAPAAPALAPALRRSLPASIFLALPVDAAPASEAERKALQPALDASDALVVRVFGFGSRADPVAIDALGHPWWPAFRATATGVRRGSGGGEEPVAEKYLDPLSGNARIDFENDLSLADQSFSSFHLTARAPVRLEGLELEAGDRVDFTVPALTEMLFHLGAALAGKRHALGRLLVFDGPSDAERLFPLAAFEDVLLGRALAPALDVRTGPAGRNAVTIEAANRSRHASMVSRTANWVEIDLSPAHPGDVAVGGFDRYEVYDANGNRVSPGRASRVRFFETLIAPGEQILPARIVARGALPADCCRYRTHVIAAAGAETGTDWIVPPKPTPAPAPPRKKKK